MWGSISARSVVLLAAIAVGATSGSICTAAAQTVQAARCEANNARFAIGEPYSQERAGRAAGARSTRRLDPETTDLIDRVTCG